MQLSGVVVISCVKPVVPVMPLSSRPVPKSGMAMAAAEELSAQDINVRVVSMPNPGRFMAQERVYRESVLPSDCKARVAVEAGVGHYWYPFVGDQGRIIGIDSFGASAPASELFEFYGLTVDNVSKAVRELLETD